MTTWERIQAEQRSDDSLFASRLKAQIEASLKFYERGILEPSPEMVEKVHEFLAYITQVEAQG